MTLASRARGVFISERSCMVIYAAKRGENRIIRVSPAAEERLLNRLKAILKVTDVRRPLVGTDRFNDVWGLIISDGDALVYSTVTGRPGGIEKEKPELPEGFFSRQRPSGVKWLNGEDKPTLNTKMKAAVKAYVHLFEETFHSLDCAEIRPAFKDENGSCATVMVKAGELFDYVVEHIDEICAEELKK